MLKKILLFLIDVIFSTHESGQKSEHNVYTKSNSPRDRQRYPGEEVHRDEYGNYIEEDGSIDPYK